MDRQTLAIVLAAGKGTRMRSSLAKVMHPVGGLPLIGHVLAAVEAAKVRDTALVVAPDARWPDAMAQRSGASVFVQDPPLGTAHAVLSAREAVRADHGAVVVLFGDTPLVRPATIARLLECVRGGADVAVLAFEADDPTGYGRVLTEADRPVAIREERDASEAERAVTLCNSGIMAIRTGPPFDAIAEIGNDNAKGEHYLTDLIAIGAACGFAMALERASQDEVMGINDRAQLAAAEAAFQRAARASALEVATLLDPQSVYFSHDTVLGEDVTVEQNVVFGPGVRVGEGARIRAFSHLEGATLSPDAVVGPFARLRPGAIIGPGAHVGNFVEVKNATLGAGAKAGHLTYLGDASIGAGANIGAGTITCNYDGKTKHRTEIGEKAFVGSNSALIAPVAIGERAYVGSGSVVTEDVPAGALAIGRGRQVNKENRSPQRPEPPAPAVLNKEDAS